MLVYFPDDNSLIRKRIRKNERIESIRVRVSDYVNFVNAVHVLYCPMTAISLASPMETQQVAALAANLFS